MPDVLDEVSMKMSTRFVFVLLIAAPVIVAAQTTQGQRGQGRFNAGDRVPGAPAGNSRPFCCDYTVRPPLFFRETFDADIPNETPITQRSITNPNVILSTWGPGKAGIRRSHHTFPSDDPKYTFSGPAKGNWAVTLRHKDSYVDLRTVAKIKWRANNSGLRALHIIIKTADGKWYISEQADGPMTDWREREFTPRELTWLTLDINAVVETGPAYNLDLSKVDEIGYTDLMTGGDVADAPSGAAASRVDWIEVWGFPLSRSVTTTNQ